MFNLQQSTLLFLLTFCVISYTKAQKTNYRHYKTRDGLSGLQVTALYEDSSGRVWIGSKTGLSVSDGHRISPIALGKDNEFVEIHHIIGDKQGGVWVLNAKPNLLYIKHDSLQTVYSIPETKYYHMLYKPQWHNAHTLEWQNYTKDSLLCFDRYNKTFFCKPNHQSDTIGIKGYKKSTHTAMYAWQIAYDKSAQLVGSYEKLRSIDSLFSLNLYKNWIATSRSSMIPYHSLACDSIDVHVNLHSHLGDEHHIVVRKGVGESPTQLMVHQNLKEGTEKQFYIPAKLKICALILDKEQNIWLGTEKGLLKFYKEGFHYYDKDFGVPSMPWAIAETAEQQIWIGSYQTGELLALESDGYFRQASVPIPKNDVGSANRFYCGASKTTSGEVVWTATYQSYLQKEGKLKVLKAKDFESFSGKDKPQTATMYLISYADKLRNEVAVGGVERFLVYDQYRKPKACLLAETLKGKNVLAIEKLDADTYFLGLNKGYLIYHVPTDRILAEGTTPFEAAENQLQMRFSALAKDGKGNIWCGVFSKGETNLYLYDKKQEKFEPVLSDFATTQVENLLYLPEEDMMLFSQVDKMYAIDLKKFYNQKEVNYLAVLDEHNGFVISEPAQNSLMQDSKGELWVLTGDELVYNLGRIDAKIFDLPAVQVTDLEVSVFDADSMRWVNGGIASDLPTLAENVRSFRFQPIAATQHAPEQLRYAFRLRQSGGKWGDWQSDKEYFNAIDLGPAKYEIEFCAYYYYDLETYQNKKTRHWSFEIEPKFYETWWFVFILTILGIGGVVLLGLYLKAKQAQAIQDKQIKMQAAQLAKSNQDLVRKNSEIAIYSKELESKNSELLEKNEEVASQKEEIEMQNTALQASQAEADYLRRGLEHDLKNDLILFREVANLEPKELHKPEVKQNFIKWRDRLLQTLEYYQWKITPESKYALEGLLQMAIRRLPERYNRRDIEVRINVRQLEHINPRSLKLKPMLEVINELLRNTYKHAFPPQKWKGEKAVVDLQITQDTHGFIVDYRDNGVGMPPHDTKRNEGYDLIHYYARKKDFTWGTADEGQGFRAHLYVKCATVTEKQA
ncbi:MAG: hypothetical protein JJT94_01940 [Bernardetiaceae bacterium]|nr:hypothetical protein [Bernardetiaceae bacterium]